MQKCMLQKCKDLFNSRATLQKTDCAVVLFLLCWFGPVYCDSSGCRNSYAESRALCRPHSTFHSAGLCCPRFYREESTAQRRDRRKMWIEDKHSSHLPRNKMEASVSKPAVASACHNLGHVRDEERQMLENATVQDQTATHRRTKMTA